MKVSTLIKKLESEMAIVGDVEVVISDGFECVFYKAKDLCDFEVDSFDEDGEMYVEIAVGGTKQ